MTNNSVEIRDLDLHFGAVKVLQQLNLDIHEGEFLVLLGSSGCGKSTLLNCIAGLLEITDGQIWIKGENVTWAEPSQRGIGMVFQSYALYPQMTVRGNLSFGLRNARVPKDEIERRVSRAAEVLQIGPLLDRKPAALSGGQRQRVAIGRALVRDVDVFLFDEPLSNLDAKLRADLRVELKRLHNQLENTMIYVTHDQVEAMTLADRIAIMKGGKIMQLGTPDEIYNRPQNLYVADFIGSPSMNFIQGKVNGMTFTAGDLSMPLDGYQFSGPQTDGQTATIGIRPEHVITGELVANAPMRTTVNVDIVEPMGSDTLVWADLAGKPFRIRMDGQATVSHGDSLEIGLDLARSSLFDTQSELRL
ncbi:ABC transporter ATP-binding protein [Ponticoccus sp. SC2-23]|uniref:ABC transporter ATP-binding protein n=1 Tax=Alexandriicola marinus TaxID=2081710 RepID=UPI000FD914B7|nr:ABC transporter ATP-binding protein [Alexandriicola marinus]MBM1220585.1 ABC transporter ATP-binding protein [Ponticoccus sp. SC6-9]MBM1225271.1 ABC transporter ATP-binding protein [Ponticoccus sp. SC6-15]MBM1228785.1 ABC transporter ATP-binding protein [Ponticoccus sp. SC6-38]MBM1233578.1 ABC transporter ATP-binding protein [Ponticoccus sp. SC6-45]MBM1239286.1 ABC transporter ATP-binding protein [Ponticoccus sp. SC6-49]MBM1243068.1 ABC transporter ATP-binding protein [Ponticoccus sp. SC2-